MPHGHLILRASPNVHDPHSRGKVVLGCQLEQMLHFALVCLAFLKLILEPLQPETLTKRKAGMHGSPRSPCAFPHLAFAQQGDVLRDAYRNCIA